MSDSNSGNWFVRHKVFTVILALVAVGFVAMATGGTDTSSSTGGEQTKQEAKEFRFSDRADAQATDLEVLPGETAEIDGMKVTVDSAKYAKSLSEFSVAPSGKIFLVITVTLENASDETKSYNGFDFRVQAASGQVLDQAFESVDPSLGSGDLVTGGKTTGKVVFEVPVEKEAQYVIWKPGLDPDRAIVQVQQ